jgi:hypothetical protein
MAGAYLQKKGLLFGVLLVPVLVISFLYIFGDNKYEVKANRRLPTHAASEILSAIRKVSAPTLVGLVDSNSTSNWMRKRVDERMRRLHKEGGLLPFYYLDASPTKITRTSEATTLPVTQDLLNAILTKDLGFPADTGEIGYWYILLDSKGHLLNAYDLRKERFLDTLALETTIVSNAK